MRSLAEIQTELSSVEQENQKLGIEHDAIVARRQELRARMDELIKERHVAIAMDSIAGVAAVAPGTTATLNAEH